MRNLRRKVAACSLGFLLLGLAPARIFAGDSGKNVLAPEEPSSESRSQFRIPAEYDVEETYIGEADVSRGRQSVHDFDESDTVVSFVLTPRISIGVLRLGASYERFSFGFDDGGPLPDTLQAANLVVGLDTQFSDSILVRIEAQPGLYGAGMDDLEWEDANVPFVIGGTYIYRPDLQFVLGIGVDVNRKYPVLPGGGVRWKFATQWVLNAVLPAPRLEYELNRQFTLYAGAVLKDETFRTGNGFGTAAGKTKLDRAVLNYTEVRTGIGFDWKIAPALTLTAEAGYLPYREFDFFRTNVRYHHDGGAPFGTVSMHGAF
jgi:hypothetical protein